MTPPRVVVIGAGIVGCALADELVRRGWTDLTVLDRGPLFATGGSTSHAPGLVFQTNPSKTMTEFARYTVAKYTELGCFNQVGGIEVATGPARLAELHRRHGFAQSWGVADARVLPPDECVALHPLLDPDRVLGGLWVPSDGLADPVGAAAAQARTAQAGGARFVGGRKVVGIEVTRGAVAGVHTSGGFHPADVVVACAGFWGPMVGAMVGLTVPLLPLAHQYARTGPVSGGAPDAVRPILRHQDRDLYFRDHGDRVGVGSYQHDPMPVDPASLIDGMLPFTSDDFAPAWADAVALLPALRDTSVDSGLNGVFSFTPDGFPVLGESRDVCGFWVAEAVWITHSAGVARAMAQWLVDGRPDVDLHECELYRFETAQLAPPYVAQRAKQNFVEVYDIIHPLDPPLQPRPLRVSPFYPRQVALDAYFLEAAGWERPHWYGANAALPRPALPDRDEWAARHWSPIVAGEALATRERVGLFDMTPLKRLAVTGPDAVTFLQRLTTNDVDRPVGTVTYGLLLDDGAGIRSDITVARLADREFQLGVNGMLDLDWLLRRVEGAALDVRDITGGTCCLGLWGPLAREVAAPLATDDLSFGYFRAARTYLGDVPVTMLRVSYVGEAGWEVYCDADVGLRLWDTLWAAGRSHGIVAVGRSAFNSLRLEKGYRAWGVDMTPEHDPYSAGLGFAVKPGKGEFVGRAALRTELPAAGGTPRRLACLTVDNGRSVAMGKEPVYVDGAAAGYVTSAAYGYTVGASIAYAWLPASAAVPGTPVQIGYFDERLDATVVAEPLFDPQGKRMRT